jgi:hypothetical protein
VNWGSVRLGCVLLGLATVFSPAHGGAVDNSCKAASTGIDVQDARLQVTPDLTNDTLKLVISGRANISGMARTTEKPTKTVCWATIGDMFLVNDVVICSLFENNSGGFSGEDRISQDQGLSIFEQRTSIPLRGPDLSIKLFKYERVCADHVVIDINPASGTHIRSVNKFPLSLKDDRAEFELTSQALSEGLDIRIALSNEPYSVVTSPTPPKETPPPAPEPPMAGPRSWNDPIGGVHVQRLMLPILLSLAIALLFTFFEKTHPLKPEFNSVATHLRGPITLAMSFYAAGALFRYATEATSAAFSRDSGVSTTLFIRISDALHDATGSYARTPFELLFVTAFLAAASAVHYVVRRAVRRQHAFAHAFAFPSSVMFYGSGIAAAALAFSTAQWLADPFTKWLGYEIPALVISASYAGLAMATLGRSFGFSSLAKAGLALILTVTVFFPSEPVVLSQYGVNVGDNTAVWARFLTGRCAYLLYIATLTGFAFELATSVSLKDRLVAEWLLFLVILQNSGLTLANPTQAFAVTGVLLISSRWLLAPETPTAINPSPVKMNQSIERKHEQEVFPLIVGGVSAGIFLFQFILDTGGDQEHRHVLLSLSEVPVTFALGATAALTISRTGHILRGDSAALKAANVCSLIVATNLASALGSFQGRESLIGAFAGSLGVIAALILSGVAMYDLELAKAKDGHFEWKDLFKGTTLARAVPIASASAIAIFSALSPILIREVGDAFGSLLKEILPHVTAGK